MRGASPCNHRHIPYVQDLTDLQNLQDFQDLQDLQDLQDFQDFQDLQASDMSEMSEMSLIDRDMEGTPKANIARSMANGRSRPSAGRLNARATTGVAF
jgi:predicted Zn-dependent protease